MRNLGNAMRTLAGLSVALAIDSGAATKPEPTESATMVVKEARAWQPCQGLPGCVYLPLRGDAGREASEALFRLQAGIRFPRHWHTSPERLLVLQGTLVMNLKNGESHSVGPRNYLYNPGGMVHWGHCVEGADCVYYVHDEKPYDIHIVQ